MLEWYEAYADYRHVMERLERLIQHVAIRPSSAARRSSTTATRSTSSRHGRGSRCARRSGESRRRLRRASRIRASSARLPPGRPAPISTAETVWPRIVDELLKQFVRPNLIQPTVPHRLPGRALAAGQAQAGRSDACRAVPALSSAAARSRNAFTELNDPLDQLRASSSSRRDRDAGDRTRCRSTRTTSTR